MRSLALFGIAWCLTASGFVGSIEGQQEERTIAVDDRLAAAARLAVGDAVVLSAQSGEGTDTEHVRVGAILEPSADPAAIARSDYRIRMHLDQLQSLVGYGDRVDRFAILSAGGARDSLRSSVHPAPADSDVSDSVRRTINRAAFGFYAYRSADVAVHNSRTFQVVRRFHRAIAVITIVASAIFLLCLLWLRVEERRREVAALRLIGISARTIVASIVLEAAVIALIGSGVGVGVGYAGARVVNWHYQHLYQTPLTFALITPGIVTLSVGLSCALGVAVGWIAALRLVTPPPLTLFGR